MRAEGFEPSPSGLAHTWLSKAPARGTWFDASGVTVKVEDVRHFGSELVIFGARVSPEERPSLNPKKQRRVLAN
jgi:hypothetical protein